MEMRYPEQRPAQHQEHQPGSESEMHPRPEAAGSHYRPSSRLLGKAALVTGGDSGIGRSIAILFAREDADVAVVYLNEHEDARETQKQIEAQGRKCVLIAGDAGDEKFCRDAVARAVAALGHLDILVNNAAEQHPQTKFEDISAEQLERTFRTNIFSYFHMAKAALPHLKAGASIINTTSVTAYKGNPMLIDYSTTKGAIVAFTRSLSQALIERGIRVNGVAPGPIWTPLIPSTFPKDRVESFGRDVPIRRPGQPEEVAPSYVFLASQDASYMAGQILHPNGGVVVNG